MSLVLLQLKLGLIDYGSSSDLLPILAPALAPLAYSRSCSGFDLLPILGPGRELVVPHNDLDITYQLVGRPIGFGATLKHTGEVDFVFDKKFNIH